MQHPFIHWLQEYVNNNALPGIAAHRTMTHKGRPIPEVMPESAKKSAVLLLLYPNQNQELTLVLIQRSNDGGNHSGQIAFPGGKVEPSDENLWATALRESLEEISLSQTTEYIAALTPVYIPVSNFNLYPFVGYTDSIPSLHASDDEVANIFHITLDDLFQTKKTEKIWINPPFSAFLEVSTYPLADTFVWGATAMVLAELEVLYQKYST